jgi:hypothetical protein
METKNVRRVFSTEFKKEKVGLIELAKLTVCTLQRATITIAIKCSGALLIFAPFFLQFSFKTSANCLLSRSRLVLASPNHFVRFLFRREELGNYPLMN